MEIISFSPSDQLLVSSFWREIFGEMGWDVRPTDGFDDIAKFFHVSEGGFVLAVKNGEGVVGCGGVKPLGGETGLIKRFYVAAALRGRGTAGWLLDTFIKESRRRGFERLVLDVWNQNPRAIRFYEKHGFKRYSPQPSEEWPESKMPETYFYYHMLLNERRV